MLSLLKNNLSLIIKVSITLLTIYIIYCKLSSDFLIETLKHSNFLFIFYGLLLLIFQPLLSAQRFFVTLKEMNIIVPFHQMFRINYIISFANQLLPASIGAELIRLWYFKKNNCSLQHALHSIFFNYFSVIISLIFLIILGAPSYYSITGENLFFISLFLIIIFAGIYFLTLIGIRIFINFLIKQNLSLNYKKHLEIFVKYFFKVKLQTNSFIISIIQAFNNIISMYFFGLAFCDISFGKFLFFAPIILIVSSLPISIAGWGVRELTVIYLLPSLGISEEISILISTIFGLSCFLISLPGIFYYLTEKSNPEIKIVKEDSAILH